MDANESTPDTRGRCTCGSPDCSDAAYLLPTPTYVHRTGPDALDPQTPVVPAQREAEDVPSKTGRAS